MGAGVSHDRDLAMLREDIAQTQLAQVAHRRRVMILFEGPDASGKKFALKQLAGALDPCHYSVSSVCHERREAAEGHWLARFWRQLPAAGQTALFFRSWYRRVLDDRLHGRIEDKDLARAFDEINEFEAQQRDYGTLIIKLYFDVSSTVQRQRLAERAANPWRAAIAEPELVVSHPGYAQAFEDLRDNSDTRWSPWTIINGDDEAGAACVALSTILESYRSAMPSEPSHLVKADGRAA